MSMRLDPMGTLTVHIDESWSFPDGPLGGRSCSAFTGVVWESPQLTARSVWANGTYQLGDPVAQVHVRVLLRDDDGVLLFLDYLARTDMPAHVAGRAPVIMSGRFEAPESVERYAWLNRTQVVGMGRLDMEAKTQTYDMYALGW